MITAAFFGNDKAALERVYPLDRRDTIGGSCTIHPETITARNLSRTLPSLMDVAVIFSTWGMPALTRSQIARMPKLKVVFYAAGSVKAFADPFLAQGIHVVSAWAANAVPVAEFVVAQILLANKGYFRTIRDRGSPRMRSQAFRGIGNYRTTLALLGAGMIGRKVRELTRPFCLPTIIFDPFLSEEDAAKLGVKKVSLVDAFKRGMVVSNHLADVAETKGLLGRLHFNAMRKNAVFINTGRGATVVEKELVSVFEQRPDLTALLDVTYPEPPSAESPLHELPNVILSSHIAGSIGDEVLRMADTMIEEFLAWRDGRPLRHAVTAGMLATMA